MTIMKIGLIFCLLGIHFSNSQLFPPTGSITPPVVTSTPTCPTGYQQGLKPAARGLDDFLRQFAFPPSTPTGVVSPLPTPTGLSVASPPCFRYIPGQLTYVNAFINCWNELPNGVHSHLVTLKHLKELPGSQLKLIRVNALRANSGWVELVHDKATKKIKVEALVPGGGIEFNTNMGKVGDSLVYITHPNYRTKVFAVPYTLAHIKTFGFEAACEAKAAASTPPSILNGGGTPVAPGGGPFGGGTPPALGGGGTFGGGTPAAPAGGGTFGGGTPPAGGGTFGGGTPPAPAGGGTFGGTPAATPAASPPSRDPFSSSSGIFGSSSSGFGAAKVPSASSNNPFASSGGFAAAKTPSASSNNPFASSKIQFTSSSGGFGSSNKNFGLEDNDNGFDSFNPFG